MHRKWIVPAQSVDDIEACVETVALKCDTEPVLTVVDDLE